MPVLVASHLMETVQITKCCKHGSTVKPQYKVGVCGQLLNMYVTSRSSKHLFDFEILVYFFMLYYTYIFFSSVDMYNYKETFYTTGFKDANNLVWQNSWSVPNLHNTLDFQFWAFKFQCLKYRSWVLHCVTKETLLLQIMEKNSTKMLQ
jgi:hypothetical protein